jgi:hypothetical protein
MPAKQSEVDEIVNLIDDALSLIDDLEVEGKDEEKVGEATKALRAASRYIEDLDIAEDEEDE